MHTLSALVPWHVVQLMALELNLLRMISFSSLPFLKGEVVGPSCPISTAESLFVCLHTDSISEPQLPHACSKVSRGGWRHTSSSGSMRPPSGWEHCVCPARQVPGQVCPTLGNDLNQPKKSVCADSSVRKIVGLWQKQFSKASRAVSLDKLNYN